MSKNQITEDLTNSPLYSEDLAPTPVNERSWGLWDMAAIWVGMAVCIPTYLLASYMIKSGLSWLEALIIIALGNVIITVPMVLNGHPGVKYGIPFPVIGRAAFGTVGIHLASVVRGLVACGWFGIQTWIGGLAFYAIWCAATGATPTEGLGFGKFVGFALFWLLNVFFIWKGTESIKWLEKFAAPILIAMGIALIVWGAQAAGGFGIVLKQSAQLAQPTAVLENNSLSLFPITDKAGQPKANEYQLIYPGGQTDWAVFEPNNNTIPLTGNLATAGEKLLVKFRKTNGATLLESSAVAVTPKAPKPTFSSKIWSYLLWLTAMVGFWATMAISIADITRFTKTQRNQVMGQFIGLPGTMALFSFVGIFVTCAAVINFGDILVADQAPWDPVSLLAKFSNPVVVIIAQILMIIATLSTNIAANVIAPANAFSNVLPSKISFRTGGIIAAILGIVVCPWWILNEISGLLIFVSGFLGPVLAILLCDYFVIRKKTLSVNDLFKTDGAYTYSSGFNMAAMWALLGGVAIALIGLFVEQLSFLYTLSWFTGFAVAFVLYYLLMRGRKPKLHTE